MTNAATPHNRRGRQRRGNRKKAKPNGASHARGGNGAKPANGGNGAARPDPPGDGSAASVGHLLNRLQALRHQGAVADYLARHAVDEFLGTDAGPPRLTIGNSSGGTEQTRPEAVLEVSAVLEHEARRCRQHAAAVLDLLVQEIPMDLLTEVQREPHPLAEAYDRPEPSSHSDEAVPRGAGRAESARRAVIGVGGGR